MARWGWLVRRPSTVRHTDGARHVPPVPDQECHPRVRLASALRPMAPPPNCAARIIPPGNRHNAMYVFRLNQL